MGLPGKYRSYKSENFDEYMKACGIGLIKRKLANGTWTLEIHQQGHTWTIKTSIPMKSDEITFKLNEPFDHETMDGRKCKSTFSLEGDSKLIQKQTCTDCSSEFNITFETHGTDELTFTGTVGKVVAVGYYKRVQE